MSARTVSAGGGWRLLEVERPGDPYYNLAVEEAVARAVGEGVAPATLRFWRNDNAIVIGAFQCVSLEIRLEECVKYGVKVVRRFTGGGAVYHDIRNLNYAISFRRPSPIPGDDILSGYRMVGEAVIAGLEKLGVKAEFIPVNDIQVGGRKISGMAGTLTRNLLFIHGCLLVGSNIEILSMVLNVPREKLEAKGVGSVRARVTTLRDELNREITMDEVKRALLKGFEGIFGAEFIPGELTNWEKDMTGDLYRSKYLTIDWNLGPCRGCPDRDKDALAFRRVGLAGGE
jgi:lipoate-protein ligase A